MVDVSTAIRMKSLRAVRDVQATEGNWDVNGYMLGMYNGLELALAILEDREPEYRFNPRKEATEINLADDWSLSQLHTEGPTPINDDQAKGCECGDE